MVPIYRKKVLIMENFLSLAAARYSVRKFSPTPIANDILQRILEAGRLAPTACNNQALHVYVIKSAEALAQVQALTKYTFGAPVILCVCYDSDRTWKNPLESGIISGEQDAAIVATQMMLQAWEDGIGSCWVGYFPPHKLAETLKLPDNHHPVLLMPIGHPAEDAAPGPLHEKRRSLDELVTTL